MMKIRVTGVASKAAVVKTVIGQAIGINIARATKQDIVDKAKSAGQNLLSVGLGVDRESPGVIHGTAHRPRHPRSRHRNLADL